MSSVFFLGKRSFDQFIDGFESLGSKPGTSPMFNIPSGAPARKTGPLPDDFLSSEGDKNDYEW